MGKGVYARAWLVPQHLLAFLGRVIIRDHEKRETFAVANCMDYVCI